MKKVRVFANAAFKLCRKYCIYEISAHDCHHNLIFTSEKIRVLVKLRLQVGGMSKNPADSTDLNGNLKLTHCTFLVCFV